MDTHGTTTQHASAMISGAAAVCCPNKASHTPRILDTSAATPTCLEDQPTQGVDVEPVELPAPISARERALNALVASHKPLWLDMDALFGDGEGMVQAAHRDPALFRATFAAFLRRPVPAGVGLAGSGSPFKGSEARILCAVWSLHQTMGGDWTPFGRALKGWKVDRAERVALFVQRRLSAFASAEDLGWSWAECRRSIHRGLEGSHRACSGYGFEAAARAAVQRVATPLGWEVSEGEVALEGLEGEARLDVVALRGDTRIVLACKSSLIDSTNHAVLYEREVAGSLQRTNTKPEHAVLILGGPGWNGVRGTSALRSVCVPNLEQPAQALIDTIAQELDQMGVFA